MASEQKLVQLFSYGTLQDEQVQLATFGRKLNGEADSLSGYRLSKIPVKDQPEISGDQYYLNAQHTGQETDTVVGTKFEVTQQELEDADVYEATANYERITVKLDSGAIAWVYVSEVTRATINGFNNGEDI
jgi:gamma-glutamylcyclotransferase (GGCT)/AIG2-like uncharacterized protein YtfP